MNISLRPERRQHRTCVALLIAMGLKGCTALGQIVSFPFSESFDTVVPPALPVGWASSQKRSPGVNDFTATQTTPNSPPQTVVATNSTIAQWLRSPIFDMSQVIPDSLVFWVRRSSSFAASLVVEASTDGGGKFDFPVGDTINSPVVSGYERIARVLPVGLVGKGQTVLRWRMVPASTGSTGTLRIDDVHLTVRTLNDLAITRVMIAPLPAVIGDSICIRATLMNRGTRTVSHASATGSATPVVEPGEVSEEHVFAGEYSGSLSAGDSVTIVLPIGRLRAGEWAIRISAHLPDDQDTSNNTLSIRMSVGVGRGSVVVNEIQYSPRAAEPEWIEVLNTAQETLDLIGWSVSDAQVDVRKPVAAAHLRISAGGMVVLTADSHALRLSYPSVRSPVVQVPAFPSLNNGGDAVVLFDGGGRVIDSVRYLPQWGGGSGTTLERIDPQMASNSISNWSSCFDSLGGTPGEVNSVAVKDLDLQCERLASGEERGGNAPDITVIIRNVGRGSVNAFQVLLFDDADGDSVGIPQEKVANCDVSRPIVPGDSTVVSFAAVSLVGGLHRVIARVMSDGDLRARNDQCIGQVVMPLSEGALRVNEIMYDPLEGDAEYVEVINASGQPVDLWSCVIHDRPTASGSCNRFVLAGGPCRLAMGELLLLISDSTILRRFPETRLLEKKALVIAGESSLGLNNDGDIIYICGPDSAVVDSVAFLPSWHNPDLGSSSGRSLEKIAPRFRSNEAQSWATCAHPLGGTPGRQNSVHVESLAAVSNLSFSPNPFSPDDDGHDDVVVIRYVLPVFASIIRARIFDVAGREVRTLINGAPSGSEGELVWDGRDNDRRKVRFGMYIIFLEASGMGGGETLTAKGVVVVGGRL